QRRHRRRAGAPRARRRRGAAGRALRAQVCDGGGQARGGLRAGHAGCPSRLRVAGQRARAGARRRARGRAGALEVPPSRMTLEELKRWYVALVLDEAGGNKVRAAELLGIDRRTLYRILEREAGPEE